MTMKFMPWQLTGIRFWLDPMIYNYLRARYGAHWQWYWINWENNLEILF